MLWNEDSQPSTLFVESLFTVLAYLTLNRQNQEKEIIIVYYKRDKILKKII